MTTGTSEDSFARIGYWIDGLASQCAGLDVQAGDLAECVDLVARLKKLGLSIDGLSVAAIGRINMLQEAEQAAETAKKAAAGEEPDKHSRPGRSGRLPGSDATIFDVVAKAGKNDRQTAVKEVKRAQMAAVSFPGFLDLMKQGRLSSAYLDVLKAVTGRELLARAEAEEDRLIGLALDNDVDGFRKAVRAWTFEKAPLAAEKEVKKAIRKEKVSVYPCEDGYKIFGWLTGLNGAALDMTLRNQIGVPARDDRRSHGERAAQALMELVHATNTGSTLGRGSGNPDATDASEASRDGDTGPAAGEENEYSSLKPGGPRSGGKSSGVRGSGGVRHTITVHVPLSTLLRTEEAIETGCQTIASHETTGDTFTTPVAAVSEATGSGNAGSTGSAATGTASNTAGSQVPAAPSTPVQGGDPLAGFFDQGDPPDWAIATPTGGDHHGHGDPPPDGEAGPVTGSGTSTSGSKTSTACGSHDSHDGDPPRDDGAGTVPDCSTSGRGLGRRGECLAGRESVRQDLGAVLSVIRAGVDVGMLEGFAPATLSDGSPLAVSQLAELMCDSDIARVVMTAHGEPIDMSNSQRLFSPRQTRAVIARDRHCRYPGCSRGAQVSQVHHAQQWHKGGATVVDNAVLLCFHHHQHVHSAQITITHHTGGFVFTDPEGRQIGITHHPGIPTAQAAQPVQAA